MDLCLGSITCIIPIVFVRMDFKKTIFKELSHYMLLLLMQISYGLKA